MLTAIISILLIVAIFVAAVNLLPTLATLLMYGLVAAVLAIKFVAKKLLTAVPWIVAAGASLAFGMFALGRQFFGAGDAKRFVEKFLPPREFERETFPLTLIELMIALHGKLRSLRHES